jgi:hypothetical protein
MSPTFILILAGVGFIGFGLGASAPADSPGSRP